MNYQLHKIPVWYWIATVFFLLWNIMGVVSFFYHVFLPEEYFNALPENQKALFSQYPLWTKIAFAMAVFGGLIGTIGLITRRKWARKYFIISLIGIIPQMIHSLYFTDTIEIHGPREAFLMPIMIVVIGIFLICFSNSCIKKGWLN